MKKFLAAAILAAFVLPATSAHAAAPRPQREAALLHWLPQRAVLHAEIRAERARHRRILERRAERQAAREAAQAAAAAASTSTPTPTATTYSTSSSGSLYISEAQAAVYMRAAGFPEDVIAWFNNGIIDRESNYCPTAVYPGHCGNVGYFVAGGPACSLFQLFPCPGTQVADPAVAAQYAYGKYRKSGLSPWGG